MPMDTKSGKSLLYEPELKLRDRLMKLVPHCVETYHLTATTLVWCIGILFFSWLAHNDIRWLWAVSAIIFLQYITDLLDGEVGRQRDTGLIKWGYYMDHLFDYLFLCSIMIGYAILLPASYHLTVLFVLALFGAFMINSFLSFGATDEFQIAYMHIGPTEVRLIFIIVNTLLIFLNKKYMTTALPYVLLFSLLGFTFVVSRTQRKIWKIDMALKNKTAKKKTAKKNTKKKVVKKEGKKEGKKEKKKSAKKSKKLAERV